MKKILLVEDDSFIVDIYSSQLQHEGYSVDVANDGELGLEKIKGNGYDLVVLDIGLPKMDGWEVLKALREDLRTQNLKVVVVSNFNEQDYTEEIKHYGVLHYFLKIQTTPQDLTRVIREVIG